MKLILSPVAVMNAPDMQISVSGLVVIINGTEYDLSVIPEGGTAEAAAASPFVGVLTRDQVTIRYEYDMVRAENNQSTDWADYTFDITDGVVPCPIKWRSGLEGGSQ